MAHSGSAFLIDFGVAQLHDEEAKVGESMAAGTPGYMAPEQARERPDARTDQYGLARTFVAMLTGAPDGAWRDGLRGLEETSREALSAALRRALCEDPGDRFHKMSDFIAALDAVENPAEHVRHQVLPIERDPSQSLWSMHPERLEKIGANIVRADYRLSALERDGLLESAACESFREETGYVDFGWSVYAREVWRGRRGSLGSRMRMRASWWCSSADDARGLVRQRGDCSRLLA